MPSDRVLEPWRSFLAEIDAATPHPLELHCIGGFAVTMHYELVRATGDLDVFDVIPDHAALWLVSLAGDGSALHKGHKLHVQIASVATLPYEYAGRLIEVFAGEFEHLRLLVADRYDLALVLVQPEMERGRSPLVNIPPFGRGFSRHRGLPIRCGFLKSAEPKLPRSIHRLDEPTRLSLGMVASPQCLLPFRPAESL